MRGINCLLVYRKQLSDLGQSESGSAACGADRAGLTHLHIWAAAHRYVHHLIIITDSEVYVLHTEFLVAYSTCSLVQLHV